MSKSVSLIPFFGCEWKVKNAFTKDNLESDEFVSDECRWRLHCGREKYCVNVFLSKLNPAEQKRTYKIRSFLEDRNFNAVEIQQRDLDYRGFDTKVVWSHQRDEFQNQRDTYLKDDGTLTLFIIVFAPERNAMGEKVSDKSIQTSLNMDSVADMEHLSLDLRRLLDDGVQSDVTLKCEERSFPAHKDILSARSEVFSAMFRSEMAENGTGVVQISDVDDSVLDQFLHYVYSGKFPDPSVDTARKLYAAADKYSMEPLKKSCSKFMEENLTSENACKILVLADIHGDKHLKDSALRFITNVELLRNKDLWLEFLNEYPTLAGEVMHHAYEGKCLSRVN